jgi:hypothetical protein
MTASTMVAGARNCSSRRAVSRSTTVDADRAPRRVTAKSSGPQSSRARSAGSSRSTGTMLTSAGTTSSSVTAIVAPR